jgi:hypothetical protein
VDVDGADVAPPPLRSDFVAALASVVFSELLDSVEGALLRDA